MRSLIKRIVSGALGRPMESAVRSFDLNAADIDCFDESSDLHPNRPTRAIYVGVTGDVKVQLAGDNHPTTFVAVPVGTHPFSAVKIFDTGTSAGNVKALW